MRKFKLFVNFTILFLGGFLAIFLLNSRKLADYNIPFLVERGLGFTPKNFDYRAFLYFGGTALIVLFMSFIFDIKRKNSRNTFDFSILLIFLTIALASISQILTTLVNSLLINNFSYFNYTFYAYGILCVLMFNFILYIISSIRDYLLYGNNAKLFTSVILISSGLALICLKDYDQSYGGIIHSTSFVQEVAALFKITPEIVDIKVYLSIAIFIVLTFILLNVFFSLGKKKRVFGLFGIVLSFVSLIGAYFYTRDTDALLVYVFSLIICIIFAFAILSAIVILVSAMLPKKKDDNLNDELLKKILELEDKAVNNCQRITELEEKISLLEQNKVVVKENNLIQNPEKEKALQSENLTEAIGNSFGIRYNKSFRAKVSLSDTKERHYYEEVKKYLLSFKGVKDRMSWGCESFNYKRNKIAKLAIRGKTLNLYLALNPDEYVDSKYNFTDERESSKYQEVPFRFKIKSDRGLKWAFELIDLALEEYSLKKEEVSKVEVEPKRSFKKNLDMGLIKELKVIEPLKEEVVSDEKPQENNFKPKEIIEKNDLPKEAKYVKEYVTTINKGVIAHLIQAPLEVKDAYDQIRNKIDGYKDVKTRKSFTRFTFYKGRTNLVVLKTSSKSKYLYIYYNLDKSYLDSKYHLKDVSNVKRLEETPLLLKVKSNRGLKYALELIEEVMKNNSIQELDNKVYTDYKKDIKPMSENKMIEKGLIKKKIVEETYLVEPIYEDENDDE